MKLYNTLTRTVEPLVPIAPPTVSMYVCGPTVYDEPHLGHVRSAYIFDVLSRYLQYRKYEVRFVRNVTDVDDKIIEKARQELGAGGNLIAKCREVSERYLTSYQDALGRLGLLAPTEEPRATAYILPRNDASSIDDSMTGFISQLLVKGAAYEAGDRDNKDVYFSVRKLPGYGKLSNRTLDELQAGARVESGEQKRETLDFALWKAAKADEPFWNSPWGRGRPGWHIECSVMSTALLGDAFDIHGGGLDLIFPHHENEIAQARALGKPFAKHWVHHGLLTVNGEKMSKSLGNYMTLDGILAEYPHPDYVKLLFLKAHYRSSIDYSSERMGEAKKNWAEFSEFFQRYYRQDVETLAQGKSLGAGVQIKQRFQDAMDDDLNTPKALAALFDGVNLGKGLLSSVGHPATAAAAKSFYDALVECGGALGLFRQGVTEEDPQMLERVQQRIAERTAARKAKDFARADAIRQELYREGVLLADLVNDETVWHRAK